MKSFVTALSFAALATAQVCDFGYSYDIRNQNQLQELSRNCSTIIGQVRLASNFTGPFALPNVVNITGFLSISRADPENISSIEFPDLEYVGGTLSLEDIAPSRNVSFPVLKSVSQLLYMTFVEDGQVSFPELTRANEIFVNGNLSDISFPALQDVTLRIDLRNGWEEDSATNLNLSLPILERAGTLNVHGNVSCISAPEFTTFSTNPRGLHGELNLWLRGDPIPVAFPKLKTVEFSLVVTRSFESTSFPALEYVNNTISIEPNTDDPVPVDLPVKNVTSVALNGNIDSVRLPNLDNITDFSLLTHAEFDCDALRGDLNGTVRDENFKYSCHSWVENVSLSLDRSMGAMFIVAAGTVGVVVIVGVF